MNKFKFKKKDLVQLIKEVIENMNEQDNVDQLDEIFGFGSSSKLKKKMSQFDEEAPQGLKEILHTLFVDDRVDANEYKNIMNVLGKVPNDPSFRGILGKITLFVVNSAKNEENPENKRKLQEIAVDLSRSVKKSQQIYREIAQQELSGFEKSPQATQSDVNRMKRSVRTPFSTRGGAGMIPGSVAESKQQQQIENLIVEQISKTLENLV